MLFNRQQAPGPVGGRPRLAGASDVWIQEIGREAEVPRLPGQQEDALALPPRGRASGASKTPSQAAAGAVYGSAAGGCPVLPLLGFSL